MLTGFANSTKSTFTGAPKPITAVSYTRTTSMVQAEYVKVSTTGQVETLGYGDNFTFVYLTSE